MATRPRRRTATAASGLDRDAALAQYRRRAHVYDLELAAFEPIRRDTVRRSVTTLDGLERPWALLERRLGPMRVTTAWLGAVYIAEGIVP